MWNTLFPSQYIKKIAITRGKICEGCVHYDKYGESEKAFVKGKPACGICGCNIRLKTHCLSCDCALKDIQFIPWWKSEMSEKEEDLFRKKTGIKNEL